VSFPHADHPLWQRSTELVFDCFLILEVETLNPVLKRLRRIVETYVATLQAGLISDFGALKTARNLLAQIHNHVVLAGDLGLLAGTVRDGLRRQVAVLAPLFPATVSRRAS